MKIKLILTAIVLIASALRLIQLGETPRGLYVDEPSLGYNAYSILKTGKDEHGAWFPLAFRAYGEYKLPGYIYGSTPLIAIFGLSAFSTRLLSALAGIAGSLAIYLFAKEFLKLSHKNSAQNIALIAAILWAFSPWSIHFSRGAFEANVMLTLTVFGLYFLHKYLVAHKYRDIAFATIFLIAAFYTYNAARLFIPLFLIATIFYNLKTLPRILTSISLIILVLLMLPGFIGMTTGQGGQRIQQVFELENKEHQLGAVFGVTQKYLTHFSPQFLFFEGDTTTARHGVGELGLLYFPELISMVLGLYLFAKSQSAHKPFLFSWLLLAPLPAALATPAPHALRAILLLPLLIILSAIGVNKILDWINRKITFSPFRIATVSLIFLASLYSVATYLHVYYQHYKFRTSWDWNEDKTKLAEYLATIPEGKQKFIIEGSAQDMIYIKFFNASKNKETKEQKYIFTDKTSTANPQNGDIVAISGWKGTPEELKNVHEIKLLNNSIGHKVGRWESP